MKLQISYILKTARLELLRTDKQPLIQLESSVLELEKLYIKDGKVRAIKNW